MTSFLSETQASVDVLQNVVFSIHPLNAFEDGDKLQPWSAYFF